MRVFWTAVALLGALLLQTALTQIAPGHARILDPFLIVLVYCALIGGEMQGMLAGGAAGWIQDIHFGGSVLGLSGLTKILIGFAVGAASTRASVFDVTSYDVTPAGILVRAIVNAVVGVAAYELVERRSRFRIGVRRRA
jgi:rod shape-determining protein MreD